MSFSGRAGSAFTVEALHPVAREQSDRADLGSISSSGSGYTYRGRVGFAAASATPPRFSAQAPVPTSGPRPRVAFGLPWLVDLPHDDLLVFVEELREAVDTGDHDELIQLLEEWQATAEVHQDWELHQALSATSVGDLGPVPSPLA